MQLNSHKFVIFLAFILFIMSLIQLYFNVKAYIIVSNQQDQLDKIETLLYNSDIEWQNEDWQ